MEKTITLFILALLILFLSDAVADNPEPGEEYRNWCTRTALAEKIEPSEQPQYVMACIDELVEADKNPDNTSGRRSRGEVENDG